MNDKERNETPNPSEDQLATLIRLANDSSAPLPIGSNVPERWFTRTGASSCANVAAGAHCAPGHGWPPPLS